MYYKNINLDKESLPEYLDSENTLVLIFFANARIADALKVKEKIPLAQVIGCSSAGEIINNKVNDNSVVVSVLKFNETKIRTLVKSNISSATSKTVGKEIAQEYSKKAINGLLILSEGLNVNGSQLIEGISENLSVPLFGGLAGDSDQFKSTNVIFNGEVINNGVVTVGFHGEKFKMVCGVDGGWINFGPKRKVTKAVNNTLYELDHKPALALYKD